MLNSRTLHDNRTVMYRSYNWLKQQYRAVAYPRLLQLDGEGKS
jgi:hypothetical protein